jgi:hypothetical protein
MAVLAAAVAAGCSSSSAPATGSAGQGDAAAANNQTPDGSGAGTSPGDEAGLDGGGGTPSGGDASAGTPDAAGAVGAGCAGSSAVTIQNVTPPPASDSTVFATDNANGLNFLEGSNPGTAIGARFYNADGKTPIPQTPATYTIGPDFGLTITDGSKAAIGLPAGSTVTTGVATVNGQIVDTASMSWVDSAGQNSGCASYVRGQ